MQSRDVLQAAVQEPGFVQTLADVTDRVADALTAGKKILLAGNGGSAADAQHIAGEFLSQLNYDRAPIAAIALTNDTSVLTSAFERQVLGLGLAGDVFIAISTSGALRASRGQWKRHGRGNLPLSASLFRWRGNAIPL